MRYDQFDVVIIGGGPAGLSAALVLGRCCRRVLVCDNGKYRNDYSQVMHGFLTRDGIHPAELRQIGREQLCRYETVQIRNVTVIDALRQNHEFMVTMENGECVLARRLLLATGLCDEWPKIKGAKELYGRSIFHCPYCDAWEVRHQPLAVYGRGDKGGGGLALELTLWSKDIVLCSDGPAELSDKYRERLKYKGISIREERIIELEGKEGILQNIIFEGGVKLMRRAIFFNTPSPQRSHLASRLGCELDEKGGVKAGKSGIITNIPGLFVAGDVSRDVFQAIVAASEGSEAAVAINSDLLQEDLEMNA